MVFNEIFLRYEGILMGATFPKNKDQVSFTNVILLVIKPYYSLPTGLFQS